MAPENPTIATQQHLVGLPMMVVGPVDVGRLLRELEKLDNDVLQQQIQKTELKMPKTSKMMDELITLNKLNLLDEGQRKNTKHFLATLKAQAPLLHMSFCADPSPLFVERLVTWLRKNIHPLTLLTVGLQPNIGAGSIVRTSNKYFDFSLSKHFGDNRELLMSKLRAEPQKPAPGPALVATAAPVAAATVAAPTPVASTAPKPEAVTAV